MDFLKKYLIEIDYRSNKLILHKAKLYKYNVPLDTLRIIPHDKQRIVFKTVVAFDPGQGLPPFNEECIIDLGAGGNSVYLSTRLVNKHKLLNMKSLIPLATPTKVYTREIVTGFSTQFRFLKIGNFNIDTPSIRLITSKKGMSASVSPMLGSYIFKRFGRIFIDFQNDAIYVPKTSN
ncbi:MAG: hypothetical protein EOO47_28910 [Flavobacterium sp.]|nr:MAG: hypothetical protein EOO47_28910 [Flavobacterium sp.]